ncbi:MAG: YhbY family RNA-binding protein [Candidatus Pacearchaeota archaeon]|nr:YhbY family RNA-binding protein [Candidatus Pacearchaeota archaeon]
MRKGLVKFQMGKNGVTDNFIFTLQGAFKNNRQVRISVLKNAISEREKIKGIAEELTQKLKGRFDYKIIGFTIVLIRRPLK